MTEYDMLQTVRGNAWIIRSNSSANHDVRDLAKEIMEVTEKRVRELEKIADNKPRPDVSNLFKCQLTNFGKKCEGRLMTPDGYNNIDGECEVCGWKNE